MSSVLERDFIPVDYLEAVMAMYGLLKKDRKYEVTHIAPLHEDSAVVFRFRKANKRGGEETVSSVYRKEHEWSARERLCIDISKSSSEVADYYFSQFPDSKRSRNAVLSYYHFLKGRGINPAKSPNGNLPSPKGTSKTPPEKSNSKKDKKPDPVVIDFRLGDKVRYAKSSSSKIGTVVKVNQKSGGRVWMDVSYGLTDIKSVLASDYVLVERGEEIAK